MTLFRAAGLLLLLAVAAVGFWLHFSANRAEGVLERPAPPAGGAVREGRQTVPGGRPETPLGDLAPRIPAGEAEKRAGPPPDPAEARLAARTRTILDAYRDRKVARFLDALLWPQPTHQAIREALQIASGLPLQQQAEAIEAFRRHPSPELAEILESIATTDPDPAVRNLAFEVRQSMHR